MFRIWDNQTKCFLKAWFMEEESAIKAKENLVAMYLLKGQSCSYEIRCVLK